jgi:MFS family permease
MMLNGILFYLEVKQKKKKTKMIYFIFKINILTGIIGSLFSLLQFFSSTLCGAASDRYGRKPVLLVSMVLEKELFLILIYIYLDRHITFICNMVCFI